MQTDHSLSPYTPQLQRLADARRVLEINIDYNPFVGPEDRLAIRQAKRVAWSTLADVAEEIISALNTAAGDADLEDATDVEDEGVQPIHQHQVGCPIGDPAEHSLHERPGRQPLLQQSPIDADREEDDPAEEDDHSGDALDNGELGDCHGMCC